MDDVTEGAAVWDLLYDGESEAGGVVEGDVEGVAPSDDEMEGLSVGLWEDVGL